MSSSNLFLATAVDNSTGIIVFSLDRNYRYTSFTKSHQLTMKKIWNVDIQVGDCMLDYLSDADAEKAKVNFDRAFNGEHFTKVEEYGNENFKRSFYEDRYDPVFNDEQEVIGVVVFVLDISNHLAVANKLEKTKERLNLALESGKIGVWEWNMVTDEIYWSKNIYKIFALTKSTFKNRLHSYLSLIYKEDVPAVLAALKTTIRTGVNYAIEHRVVLPDQSIRWISCHGKVILKNRKPSHLSGTVQDISHKKQAEQELLNKNEELTKINKELDRFVYSASHDLRAPISSLLGLIQLARFEDINENLRNLFTYQEKSLNRLDHFIRDIVDYSRNQRLAPESKPVDFNLLVNEAFEQFHFIEHVNQIRKSVKIDQKGTFMGDPKRIQIIINNLISNSIKYADLHKDDPFIEVDIFVNQYSAQIVVRDNGEGIHPELKEKVFDMFFRASERSNGSGLGLYIVNEVVQKLKGAIDFTSQLNNGTTFKVFLPDYSKLGFGEAEQSKKTTPISMLEQ